MVNALISHLQPTGLVAGAILAICLLAIAWIDLRRREIDPWLSAEAALAGGVLVALQDAWPDALLGAAL